MTDAPDPPNYAVLLLRVRGGFELRIRELLLVARSENLHDAYETLLRRRQEVLDLVRSMGAVADLPAPLPSPSGAKIVPG
jgi:hypothetical protein